MTAQWKYLSIDLFPFDSRLQMGNLVGSWLHLVLELIFYLTMELDLENVIENMMMK